MEFMDIDVTDAMWDCAMLVREWYDQPGNGVGGALHSVVDDDNTEDHHIEWCWKERASWNSWAEAGSDDWTPLNEPLMKQLVDALLALSETERDIVVGSLADQYGPPPRRPGKAILRRYSQPVDDDWDEGWWVHQFVYDDTTNIDIVEEVAKTLAMFSKPTDPFEPLRLIVSPLQAEAMRQAAGEAWATAWAAQNGVSGGRPVEVVEFTPLSHDPDDAVDASPAPQAEWAHSGVHLRVPTGTDPLAAIREAMGVFMERRDGTNAMEWWQRVRWWHGGRHGLKRGDILLPPSETGVWPGLDASDKTMVYITTDRKNALMYAARHERPMLYEVTLREEPIFDDVMPSAPTEKRVPSAVVWRVEQPSRVELMNAVGEMEASAASYLTSIEEPPSSPESSSLPPS